MIEKPQFQYGSITLEQHSITTTDGHPISLYRIQRDNYTNCNPVLLLHGAYSNRHFWISPKGKGFATYLARNNFDVWMLETRGHGESIDEASYQSITADEVITYDLRQASDYIYERNDLKQLLVGHSYGGLYLSLALGKRFIPENRVAALTIIGTQIKDGQAYLRISPIASLVKQVTNLMGRFPARRLKLGGEDEAPQISNQFITWKNKQTCFSLAGEDYIEPLMTLNTPVFAISGANDTIDPASGCEHFWKKFGSNEKKFCLLGKSNDNLKDYGHVDMIIGKEAEQEVWPLILNWLNNKADLWLVPNEHKASIASSS